MPGNRTQTGLTTGYVLVELIVAMMVMGTLLGITIWTMHRRAMAQRPILTELRGIFRFAAPGDCFRIADNLLYEKKAGQSAFRPRLSLRGIQVQRPVTTAAHPFCFDDARMGLYIPGFVSGPSRREETVITQDICFVGTVPSAGKPVCLSPLGLLYDRWPQRVPSPMVR